MEVSRTYKKLENGDVEVTQTKKWIVPRQGLLDDIDKAQDKLNKANKQLEEFDNAKNSNNAK